MHVLDANELFGITSYTYDKIMEVGGKYGPDAFAMYFKLLKQARMQETNQTLTLNKFLMNYFGWGDDKVTRTKKILKDLGLIDDIIVRDELGKIKGHYVRVNYLIDEQKVRNSCITYNLSTTTENQAVDFTRSGKVETNALSTKHINAGSTKNKICPATETLTDISMDSGSLPPDNSKERKEKVPPKEKKESGYSEEFEEFWKLYPAPSGRGSKKDSRKKWNSRNDEDIDKIKLKVFEECINVKSGVKDKKWVCAFEKFLENNKGVDVDIEGLVNTYMKYNGDMKKKGLELMKGYFGEDLIKRYIFKHIKENDNFNLDLH